MLLNIIVLELLTDLLGLLTDLLGLLKDLRGLLKDLRGLLTDLLGLLLGLFNLTQDISPVGLFSKLSPFLSVYFLFFLTW